MPHLEPVWWHGKRINCRTSKYWHSSSDCNHPLKEESKWQQPVTLNSSLKHVFSYKCMPSLFLPATLWMSQKCLSCWQIISILTSRSKPVFHKLFGLPHLNFMTTSTVLQYKHMPTLPWWKSTPTSESQLTWTFLPCWRASNFRNRITHLQKSFITCY